MSDNRGVSSGSGSITGINGKGLIHHWYPDAANVVSAEWSWTEGYEARTDSNGVRVLTNWHQNYPYNYYVCESETSAKACDYVAGCGPVAMAQLMAIWGKPTDSKLVKLYTYDWTQMRDDFNNISSSGAKNVAHLMYELGKHSSSKYTKKQGNSIASTKTTEYKLISTLEKMGYKTPEYFSSYDFSTVKSSIMEGRPVIASGFSDNPTFLGIPLESENGHYWLIDGVRKMTYKETLTDGASWVWDNRDFVYCNLGWSTVTYKRNAWYISGIFDCRENLQSHISRSNENHYYQYRKKILPNVYY